MRQPFNIDSFSSLPARSGAQAAMRVIDALQGTCLPETQAHGIAAAFILLSERWGMSPQEIFEKTTNLMNYAEGRRPEFAAVAEYLENEL